MYTLKHLLSACILMGLIGYAIGRIILGPTLKALLEALNHVQGHY